MLNRERLAALALVVCGHIGLVVLLVRAMAPPAPAPQPGREPMLLLEFYHAATPVPAPAPPDERPADADSPRPASPPEPRIAPPASRRTPPRPMTAIIESPQLDEGPAPEPADSPPVVDLFQRPVPEAPPQGFGRRDQPRLREPTRPRIAGEAPPSAPMQGLRVRQLGARAVLHGVGALIGGGPDAPVEGPCGMRLNGRPDNLGPFPPNWSGCEPARDAGQYDGRVELPPDLVR